MADGRQLVIVAGSGRSGTSVFSSILRELGYRIPQPEVKPDSTNPAGFGEPQWLVDFHTAQLRLAGVQTSDARPEAWALAAERCFDPAAVAQARDWLAPHLEASEHVLLKDPRITWFTTLWEQVAADLSARTTYVTMLRPPADTVKSKDHWYSMVLTPNNRVAGWVNTMLYTERATRDKERAFVLFDALLGDWAGTIGAVDERVGLPPVAEARAVRLAAADAIVDPSLPRSRGTWEDLGIAVDLASLADRVWDSLSALPANPEPPRDTYRDLDALRAEYRALYAAAEQIAQSSILAEKATGRRTAAAPGLATDPADSRKRSLSAARVIPPSLRHAMPLKARKALLRYLP